VVAVAAVVDQADLAVETFELGVRQAELDGGEDAVAVGSDGPGQRDERGDAAAAGPGQPPVEMLRCVLGSGEAVEVAEPFFELPAPVEDVSVAAQLVEDLELVVVEVVGVFEQHPAGVSDLAGSRRVARAAQGSFLGAVGAAGLVPNIAAGFVHGLVGELDDVERVDALAGIGGAGVGGLLVRAAHVQRHRLQRCAALLAEFVVEGLEGLGVLALAGPDDGAVAVVIGDDGEVAVAFPPADLVDPDPVDVLEATTIDVLGYDPGDDASHGLPARAQQLGDGGLVGVLTQPGDHVFEVTGMASRGPSPGDGLGADPVAGLAVEAADLGFQEQLRRAEIEMPPPARGAVIDRPASPATRARRPAAPMTQTNDHALGSEGHRHDVGVGDGQQLVECSGDAHVLAPRRLGWLRNPEPTKRHVRVTLPGTADAGPLALQGDQTLKPAHGPTETRGVPNMRVVPRHRGVMPQHPPDRG